jgi:ABC-type transport system substrate-binding protein
MSRPSTKPRSSGRRTARPRRRSARASSRSPGSRTTTTAGTTFRPCSPATPPSARDRTSACTATSRVDELLDQARDAADLEAYQQALSEIQNIVTWEDPAGVYYAQIQWTTILRQDIAGFTTNPIATGLYDFYRMSRTA